MSERRTAYRVRRQPTIYDSQTEAVWQASLIGKTGHATVRGWFSYHVLQSRQNVQGYSVEGFPDVCLCHAEWGRVAFIELKSERGRVTDDQRRWLDALMAAGQDVMVWYPHDVDEAVRILSSPVRVESETEWRVRRERP